MNWKKFVGALLILLAALAGLLFYMEFQHIVTEVVVTSQDTQAILEETPELLITQEEQDFLRETFQLPALRELEACESAYLMAEDCPELAQAGERFLGEVSLFYAGVQSFNNGNREIWLTWEAGGDHFSLQLSLKDGAWYKYFCPEKRLFANRVFYENWDNQRAVRSENRRRWFAWLFREHRYSRYDDYDRR